MIESADSDGTPKEWCASLANIWWSQRRPIAGGTMSAIAAYELG